MLVNLNGQAAVCVILFAEQSSRSYSSNAPQQLSLHCVILMHISLSKWRLTFCIFLLPAKLMDKISVFEEMGESQEKASSSANSLEKSSLLDFDIGKDFLSNWKPKSGGKDDVMDLNFGPITKNKKKMFDFDKVDIDFNLDGDFGNLSSFKIDMSDFDVSSPLKEDGKHKEKSKEASGRGSTKEKIDSFDFSFDFNKLGNFTFEAGPREDASKEQDKGGSPCSDDSQGSRIHITEEIAAEKDVVSQKPAASGVVSSSSANLQDDGRAHLDSTSEDLALKSVKGDDGPSNFITQEVVPLKGQTSLQTSIPIRTQQKGCQPEKMSSTGPVALETCTANATSGKKSSAVPVTQETCAANSTSEKTSSAAPVTQKTCAANETSEKMSSAAGPVKETCSANGTSEKMTSAGLVTRKTCVPNATLPEQSEKTSFAAPVTQETCDANSTLPVTSVHPASDTYSSGDTTSDLQEEVSSMATRKNIPDEEHDVNPPCSTEQAKRSTSDSCRNPKPLLPHMASIQIIKHISPEEKDTHLKIAPMMPGLPGMKLSRSDSFIFKSNSRGSKNAMKDQDKDGSPISEECQSSRIHLAEDTSVHEDGISQKPITLGALRSPDNNLQTTSKAHLDSTNEECQSSRIHLAEDTTAHEDGISQKPITLGALRSSDSNLQTSSKAHLDAVTEGVTLMSVRNEKGPSKSVTTIEEVTLQPEEASTLKPIPTRIQQTGCQPEKMSSAESVTQKACAAKKPTPDITVCCASTSDNCANAKILLPNVTSSEITWNPSPKGENSQPASKTPCLTAMNISRTFEGNLNASRAMLEKETKSMGTLTPSKLPLGEMPPKVSQLTDPQSGSLPTMSLKRKTPEPPDADRIISNPSKRLSKSPSESRNTMETSEKVVDEEVCKNLANHNARSVLENCHAYPNVLQEMNLKELESSYTIEDDSNIQKAEACSKELENMCNMLRKKLEEAKEILVRAIVNNNKLLMLNHPLYEKKIRMIKKFAAGLTLTK